MYYYGYIQVFLIGDEGAAEEQMMKREAQEAGEGVVASAFHFSVSSNHESMANPRNGSTCEETEKREDKFDVS